MKIKTVININNDKQCLPTIDLPILYHVVLCSLVSCSSVRTPLFRDVVGVIVTARVDWFSLGVHLDVPSAKLHEIKLDYQGEVELMTETIDYCFHNDINFSWGTLASALKEKGHTGIAEALMRMTPTSQASG